MPHYGLPAHTTSVWAAGMLLQAYRVLPEVMSGHRAERFYLDPACNCMFRGCS